MKYDPIEIDSGFKVFFDVLHKCGHAHLHLSQFIKTVLMQAWSFSFLYAGSYINVRVCMYEREE